ncbi:MAG: hypothetical protein B6242_13245 [Anaerolineaceae bacterium 4572_78]|nr:MAG: hypothetical protein B6242_13245 [Anaerolineaceae bacterium 4572_78]
MRNTQSSINRMHARHGSKSSNRLTVQNFVTALGIGLVLVLLGSTFLGEYLSVPDVTVSANPVIISPNNDLTQDTTNFIYSISEESHVTAQVFDEKGALITTLADVDNQPGGQYIILWDGLRDGENMVVDGTYMLQATAKGESRSNSQSVEVVVDTEPPPLQLINLDDLNRVANPSLVIEGITEPGTTVYQSGRADVIPVDSQGRFQIERQLTEGSNILEIIASDPAGNSTRTTHEVTLVTQAPELVLNEPYNDAWLNDAVLDISGVAPNAESVTINNQPVNLQEDGTFQHEYILQEGDNTLRIQATNDVGNVTTLSRLVHLKSTAPAIKLSLDEGAEFQQSQVRLTGRTDVGSTILVNNQVVAVSTLGEFQTTLNLANGANLVTIESRDIAGNTATLTRQVFFNSPVAQNELTQLLNNFPSLSSLATPLLVLIPSIMILGYFLTRPVSVSLKSDTDAFMPGRPEEQEFVTLNLDLSKSARSAIEVIDELGQSVATISQRRQRSGGQHEVQWNGYDDYGRVLPPGEYTIQATAITPNATVQSAVPIMITESPTVHRRYTKQTPTTISADTQWENLNRRNVVRQKRQGG